MRIIILYGILMKAPYTPPDVEGCLKTSKKADSHITSPATYLDVRRTSLESMAITIEAKQQCKRLIHSQTSCRQVPEDAAMLR